MALLDSFVLISTGVPEHGQFFVYTERFIPFVNIV